MIDKEYARQRKINGSIVALYLYANFLLFLLPAVNNILVLIILGITFLYIMNNKTLKIFKAKSLLIIVGILLWYGISYLQRETSTDATYMDYFTKFGFFGITSFVITGKEFEIRDVYRTFTLLSVLLIPYLIKNKFFDLKTIDVVNFQELMTMTYRILPGILASIMCITDKYETKFIKIVSIIVIISFGYTFMNMASRGAILAIAFFIMSIYLISKIKKIDTKTTLLIIFIIIITISIIMNLVNILYRIKAVLDSFNVSFRPITKTIFLLENDMDISNGRVDIYNRAFTDIKEKPFLGNGIASYEDTYQKSYVHNVFIQITYEGGLLWSSIFAIFIIIAIKKFMHSDIERRKFIMFLVAISMIQLMFSYYFWGSQKFWFLIAYIMQLNVKKE